MKYFAVIGDHYSEAHDPLLQRVLAALQARGYSMRVAKSPLGDRALALFQRNKFCFAYDTDYCLNPDSALLTQLQMRKRLALNLLPEPHRAHSRTSLAAIKGIECKPEMEALFALVMDTDPAHSKVARWIADKVDCRVFNLTDRNDLRELTSSLSS